MYILEMLESERESDHQHGKNVVFEKILNNLKCLIFGKITGWNRLFQAYLILNVPLNFHNRQLKNDC
jgi:hypothetical protein